MGKTKKKQPRIPKDFTPKSIKEPTTSSQFASGDGGQVFWSFSLIDCDGRWGFNTICKKEFHDLITEGFKDKEGLNWSTLKSGSGCHSVEKNELVKDAQNRLKEIHLDDLDQLFSMRFTGKKRVWGIRDGNVFKVLWWDPKHEVCPSKKKHT